MPSSGRSARITALDGYRAVAITVVMLHHAVVGPGAPDWLRPVTRFIPQCVIAFWVLSGFLITRSILREEERTGAIQFRKFYARQAIRFFVPLIGYLLSIFLFIKYRFGVFGWPMLIRPAILDPNTYCIAQGVSHLYSMVLQIYFWLAWPIILVVTSPRFRLPVAAAFALAALCWRIVAQSLVADGCMGRVDYFFAPLFVGAGFALAESSFHRWIAAARLNPRVFVIACAIAVALLLLVNAPLQIVSALSPGLLQAALAAREDPMFHVLFIFASRAAICIAWACLVFCFANNLLPAAGRVLSFPGLTWLGRISFSVYLWQNLFCLGLSDTRLDYFPLNLLASIVCGYIAYRLIELPSLRWRSKLKRSAISPTDADKIDNRIPQN